MLKSRAFLSTDNAPAIVSSWRLVATGVPIWKALQGTRPVKPICIFSYPYLFINIQTAVPIAFEVKPTDEQGSILWKDQMVILLEKSPKRKLTVCLPTVVCLHISLFQELPKIQNKNKNHFMGLTIRIMVN